MNERLGIINSNAILKASLPEKAKRPGHLIEGVQPIIACIGSFADFEKLEIEHSEHRERMSNNFSLDNMQNIDWAGDTPDLDAKGFLNPGPQSYVMSTIDNSNKFSLNFVSCTGLIVAGTDKITGENISFVSHQITSDILFRKRDSFITHLKQRLLEMKEKCRAGTIDAVVVGGMYFGDSDIHNIKQRYLDLIKLLGIEVQKILDFEPIVINGPKTSVPRGDDIYYDNNNRRLYFMRPEVNPNTGGFLSSEVDKEKGRWGLNK